MPAGKYTVEVAALPETVAGVMFVQVAGLRSGVICRAIVFAPDVGHVVQASVVQLTVREVFAAASVNGVPVASTAFPSSVSAMVRVPVLVSGYGIAALFGVTTTW